MVADNRPIPNYSEKFKKCIAFVLEREGYFSNHPNDKGGRTYWGLCEKYEPDEVELMSQMTEQESKDFATDWYYRNYWLKLNLEPFNTKYALIVFNLSEAMGMYKEMEWIRKLPLNVTIEWILLKAASVRIQRCNVDPTQKVFLLGWLNGIISLWTWDDNENKL